MTTSYMPDPRSIAYYQQLHFQHDRKPEAVGWTKGKEWYRYQALINSWVGHTDSVLDFGCGLGHMGIWMHTIQGRQASYSGVDVVPEFIASNKEYFKNPPYKKSEYLNITPGCFQLIESAEEITKMYDHIILCGVFNFNPGDPKVHAEHIRDTLAHLFTHCRRGLHVDFLSTDVDYQEPHHHHQSLHELVNMLKPISTRYVIDRVYLPWEFCVHIARENDIDPLTGQYGT